MSILVAVIAWGFLILTVATSRVDDPSTASRMAIAVFFMAWACWLRIGEKR